MVSCLVSGRCYVLGNLLIAMSFQTTYTKESSSFPTHVDGPILSRLCIIISRLLGLVHLDVKDSAVKDIDGSRLTDKVPDEFLLLLKRRTIDSAEYSAAQSWIWILLHCC
jgi:hypothetical protein